MSQEKEFMLMFRFEPSNEQPSSEQMLEMQNQWGEFIGNIANQGKLVSTYQFGFDGIQIFSNQASQEGPHISNRLTLSGNMVLKADTLEEASAFAAKCPILLMGGTVEVRNLIPMN